MRIFPRTMPRVRRAQLHEITLQGWSGGLNAVHDDLSMGPKFLVTADNVRRNPSGAHSVRFGDKWVADLTGTIAGTSLVDMTYFNTRLIAVSDDGEIGTITDAGSKAAIWNETIANALTGTPSGWSTGLDTIQFAPFRATVNVHNGVDKPISIDTDFNVTYLQDLATGSNVNVPIGKFACSVGNYHCIAGVAGEPTTVYISSSGTAGVFPGDPAPNDSIAIDVGAYVSEGSDEIRGLAGFKTYLLIFFQTQVLPVQLGGYDDSGNHTPQFPDSMPKFGLLGHRCIATLSNDIQFADVFGLGSAKRNLFSGLLDSKHASEYIEPKYRKAVDALTDAQRAKNCFAVYDPLSYSTIVFLPDDTAFVYTNNEKLRYSSWTHYMSVDFQCACASLLGRIYGARDMRVYQLGNSVYASENYTADKLLDRDGTWANGTAYTAGDLVFDSDTGEVYTCSVSHTSLLGGTFAEDRTQRTGNWVLYDGVAIAFDMEMPWLTGKAQMKVKHLRFTNIGSLGNAEFTLALYVDGLYKDINGTVIADPALSMKFIGNQAGGFGVDEGPFGGGRKSHDPRLYRTPCRFKSIKPRLTGSVKKPLTFTNMTFLYAQGLYKR